MVCVKQLPVIEIFETLKLGLWKLCSFTQAFLMAFLLICEVLLVVPDYSSHPNKQGNPNERQNPSYKEGGKIFLYYIKNHVEVGKILNI